MTSADVIAIIFGSVNLFALLFVGYQTYLNRKTFEITKMGVIESEQLQIISGLPKINLMIEVQGNLNMWKQDLQTIMDNEKNIKSSINCNADITIDIKHYFGNSKLIKKYLYNYLPDWLQIMLVTGARYYYEGVCCVSEITSNKKDRNYRLLMLKDIIDRSNTGIKHICEIQEYIKKYVPDWYAESSASLDDSAYIE